jgi:hypothetical protein
MIDILTIFVVMVAVFLILFTLKKTLSIFGFIFRLFSIVFVVFLIVLITSGYFIISDANDFRKSFPNSTSLYLLKDDANRTGVVAGVEINPGTKKFNAIDKPMLEETQKLYKDGKLETLNQKYYKVIVIDIAAMDALPAYNITDRNVELNATEIKSIMLSNDARDALTKILARRKGSDQMAMLGQLTASNEELKGYLLSYYLTNMFNPKNIKVFLKELNNGNILVYKNTAMFQAVRFMPVSIIAKFMPK